jgi:hypothetical protein
VYEAAVAVVGGAEVVDGAWLDVVVKWDEMDVDVVLEIVGVEPLAVLLGELELGGGVHWVPPEHGVELPADEELEEIVEDDTGGSVELEDVDEVEETEFEEVEDRTAGSGMGT